MKITGFEATPLRIPEDDPLAHMPEEAGRTRPVVILRLRTDSGIEGIGLTFYGGRMAGSLRVAVEELAALTIGEDPMRIEKIVAKLWAGTGDSCGPGGIFTLALSAIDIALWDIKGKALEQPLWKLLGGHRDRVATYASGSLRRGLTDSQAQRAAQILVQKGFVEKDADGPARQSDRGRGSPPDPRGAGGDRAGHQADVRHQPALAPGTGDRHRQPHR